MSAVTLLNEAISALERADYASACSYALVAAQALEGAGKSREARKVRDLARDCARLDLPGSREVERDLPGTVGEQHAQAGGDLCRDEDGSGCCSTCHASLDRCEECGGRGYHRTGCVESDETISGGAR